MQTTADRRYSDDFAIGSGGTAVGNYDDGTSLADLVVNMKYIVGDRGKRLCPLFLRWP